MLNTTTESQLHREDWDFVEANYHALQEKYPEHWIALIDKKVIAADPEPMELAAKLRTMSLPSNRVVIEKLTDLEEDAIIVTSDFAKPASGGIYRWTNLDESVTTAKSDSQ